MKKLYILLVTILFVSCKTIDNEIIKRKQRLFELIEADVMISLSYLSDIDENRRWIRRKRFVDAIGTYNWIMNKKDFNILRHLLIKVQG